ncbi:MAG: oxygen-dependent coproporphyrinogen oxidase [Crocinitomicaceae bacterium]|nr:oxygen-dependent coproporphyrinogen oxidase [Crocinitomicaceae bacterium]
MNKEQIAEQYKSLQEQICKGLEELDGKAVFRSDVWEREEGGGGRTNTIANGNLLEKGGVAFSAVHGPVSEAMKKQLGLEGNAFFATGVSIVLHPFSPHVPIIHMNVRYFELDNGTYWFGGGIDLTPHYVVPAQATLFHQRLKAICDKHDATFYAKHKPWADTYFHIPHRNESRGIGGIFFDHLSENNTNLSKEQLFAYCSELASSFVSIYAEQANLGKELPVLEEHLAWRNLRRGRYVEFNLVHDRGTKFGLFSGGRTESILMSLPPLANWEYDYQAKEGSEEMKTLEYLGKDWDWA